MSVGRLFVDGGMHKFSPGCTINGDYYPFYCAVTGKKIPKLVGGSVRFFPDVPRWSVVSTYGVCNGYHVVMSPMFGRLRSVAAVAVFEVMYPLGVGSRNV